MIVMIAPIMIIIININNSSLIKLYKQCIGMNITKQSAQLDNHSNSNVEERFHHHIYVVRFHYVGWVVPATEAA